MEEPSFCLRLQCLLARYDSSVAAVALTRFNASVSRARNEKIEELQDDIAEMKRIFHDQLSLCADQLSSARSELEQMRGCR